MKVPIGRIDLKNSFSFFEVEESFAGDVIKAMNDGVNVHDRPIVVELASERPGEESSDRKPERKSGRKFERTSDRKYERPADRKFEKSSDKKYEKSFDKGSDRRSDKPTVPLREKRERNFYSKDKYKTGDSKFKKDRNSSDDRGSKKRSFKKY